ncbi:MAG: NUDIX hydrolase [Euryarchaeota archaeon]|jgi:ADP-ribose pyrophosphatase YjhB (NUDIX family)|nr:NUDIX hydrolase [Euryarchaeota archaeon]MBT5594411.1 NUDIX hydrolase [Euryarchaeota archaeon]MBT5844146.1 NUDIX hydrolase [Euryarchaeota archaeon]MBT6844478.1 NUDIX hydrolase [Euryarchaeota archaeon]
MHPAEVVHLEHDGKVLLVDENGIGPQIPIQGRQEESSQLRLPTSEEIEQMGIEWNFIRETRIVFGTLVYRVIKGYPNIDWPKNWAWKDEMIADNSVHPVAREAIYRSIHRLVSKVMICNDAGEVLLGKVERGHFRGFWTLPGGYMDHDEHPSIGCVRETLEEIGLTIVLEQNEPLITQKIFTDEGISFVSFTYRSQWNGDISNLNLQTEEISEVKWFSPENARAVAVSYFDKEALRTL